jgi:hypothetical protein
MLSGQRNPLAGLIVGGSQTAISFSRDGGNRRLSVEICGRDLAICLMSQ